MQSEIANILKAKIAVLPFIDKLAGLVQTIETTTKAEGGTREIRFPAALENAAQVNVKAWEYSDLVPNSKNKNIFYFEDISLKASGKARAGHEMESSLRLVGWLNSYYPPGSDAQAIAHILNTIPEAVFNAEGFSRIKITPGKILGIQDNIFSKYTYDAKQRQFLMKPYSVFAIDFDLKFTLNLTCMPAYESVDPA